MLESQSSATSNIAGIGEIFAGSAIGPLFNLPGLPPNGDPRTPDIVVTTQCMHCVKTCPYQIPHRLVPGIGNPHCRQLASPMQPGQTGRIAPIGLSRRSLPSSR